MNAMTSVPRFLGTTLAQDRAAMSVSLPNALMATNSAMREGLAFLDAEVSAVEVMPDHPTAIWPDYYKAARIEEALQEAIAAFRRTLGRTTP